MHCASCGAALEPDSSFCGSCGAPVPAAAPGTAAPPQPLPDASAATVPMPVAVEPPPVAAPVYAPPPQAAYSAPVTAAPPKRGLSTGAVIGIVAGVLILLLLLCGGGFVAYRAFFAGRSPAPAAAPPSKPSAPKGSTSATEAAPVAAPSDAVVTEAEARDVVNQFLTLRAAGDIEGSKALCTQKMLTGPDADFVNDKYWNPDSWELTKFTPDLMYIHVTSMGVWPSGREATIFQVYREPESGKVLIDGFLDPEMFPELVTP